MNREFGSNNNSFDKKKDPSKRFDKKGNSSLHDAVKHCNPYGIKKLLKYNPDLGVSKNFKGQVPLHKAFYYINKDSTRLKWRQLESVNLLLESDAQTAAIQDDNGSLPLHLAAYYNTSYECLETLFNVYPSGALVKDGDGRIPVQYSDDPQAQKLLLGTSKHLSAVGMTNSFAQFAANS
jgi:ankyrin repeat protein